MRRDETQKGVETMTTTTTTTSSELQATIERMAELSKRIGLTPASKRRDDYILAFNQLSEIMHNLAHQD